MIQRNDTGSTRVFPLTDPPVTVGPGENVDLPTLIPGFTPVDPPEPFNPLADAVEDKPSRKNKS
jgi:hypothetical protein